MKACPLSLLFERATQEHLAAITVHDGGRVGGVVCLALDVLPRDMSAQFSGGERMHIINGLGLAAGDQTLAGIGGELASAAAAAITKTKVTTTATTTTTTTRTTADARAAEARAATAAASSVLLIASLSDLILSCGRSEAQQFIVLACGLGFQAVVCVMHESLHDVVELNFWIDHADCLWSRDDKGALKSVSTRQQAVYFKHQHQRVEHDRTPHTAAAPVVVFQQQVDDFQDEDDDDNPDDDLDL